MTVDENPSTHLIGSSATFGAALEDVKTVASADCAVLVQGETGTGKEGIAQTIHDLSPRRRHRFAVVNWFVAATIRTSMRVGCELPTRSISCACNASKDRLAMNTGTP
jgi:DNA-binding NtrC family response regulator